MGERLVARVHAHPRSMGPKINSPLYAILGSLLRNRFVSPLWINTQGRGSPFRHARSSIITRAFPLLLPPSPSSNGHLLHHHGEAKSHSRGATCSGRTKWLQEGGSPLLMRAKDYACSLSIK